MDFLTQSKVHLNWQLTHALTTQLLPPTGRVLPKGRQTSFNTYTKQYLCISIPQSPPSRSSETPARPGAPRMPRSPAASGSSPPLSSLPFGESTDTSWPTLPRSPGTGTGRACGGCNRVWAATFLSWGRPGGGEWWRAGCAGHRQAERLPRVWCWKGWGLSRPGPPSSCTSTGFAWKTKKRHTIQAPRRDYSWTLKKNSHDCSWNIVTTTHSMKETIQLVILKVAKSLAPHFDKRS